MTGYTNNKNFDEVFNKVLKEMPEEKFVVYPEPQFSMEELTQHKQMTDNENKTDAVSVTPENILEIPKMPEIITETPDFVEQNQGEIKNIPEITNIPEAAPEVPKIPEAAPEVPDLVKQNQEVPEEKKELTEEEKRANLIQAIKDSKIKFHPIKHAAVKTIAINAIARLFGGTRQVKEKAVMTNITTNKFGAAYKQKRKAKNKMQKTSRKSARKK